MELFDHPKQVSKQMYKAADHTTYSFIQEPNILFFQGPQEIIKVTRECIVLDLVVWLDCIAKVLVWRRSSNEILQVIVRK